MPGFNIIAQVGMRVVADDEDEAWEIFADALSSARAGRTWNSPVSEVEQVKYDVPPGAERWAVAAIRTDFDNLRDDSPRRMCGLYDGSWWWTNGHVLLRCDGDMPTDDLKWKALTNPKFCDAFAISVPRVPTEWTEELTGPGDDSLTRGRRSIALPEFCIQAWYFDLINDSVDEAQWLVGQRYDQPVHVLDKEGKLVAVVMGMRPESLVPMPVAA